MANTPFESIHTHKMELCCDGEAGPLGHPRVYLHIDTESGKVTCPYCSRVFIHKKDAERYARL